MEEFQNAPVREVFIAILRTLRDQAKKIKVQSSKYLTQLENFLFKINQKKITEPEFRLLLLGDEEKQLPFGLLACCGSKSKVDGNLRKSSYYSVRLLVQILEKHPQGKEFQAIFADLDEDEFKLMCLSSHILAENQNEMAAYKLVQFVLWKRPHISLNTIIEGRRVQERFQNWYKEQKKVIAQEEAIKTTWTESDKKLVTEDEVLKDQRDEKRRKKKKLLENIQLSQSEKSVDFLINTFQDPLLFELTPEVEKSKQKTRESAIRKKQISSLMTLQVNTSSNIEIIRQKLQSKGLALEQLIFKIHIDSDEFDPYVLIQSLHNDTPNSHFQKIVSQLQVACQESKNMNKSLLYFFFEDMFLLSNGLTKLHREFIRREYLQLLNIKQNLPNTEEDDLVFGRLKNKNSLLAKELTNMANSLNTMKQSQHSLRQILVFLQKFEALVKLPQEIKKAFVQKDYQQVVILYQQNKSYIQQFQSLSIFESLFQEINTNLQLSYEDIISELKRETHDFNRVCQLAQNLLELPAHVAKEQPGTLLKSLSENFQIEQIHPNAIQILEAIFGQIISDTSQYLEGGDQKPEKESTTEVTGDMINEFLAEMGMTVSKADKKQVGRKAILLNCKAVDKYFQNRFLYQFTNFYSLCVRFSKGDYDYRMGIQRTKQDIYMSGSSQAFTQLTGLIFKHLVDLFLNAFQGFLKRLQANWFKHDDVGRENKQFYKRVRSDLQSLSGILFHFEQMLLATKYQSQDSTQQKILERTKQIKTDVQILYMKIVFEEYRNVMLTQINFDDETIPKIDFFGTQISEYMDQTLESIKIVFEQLGAFASHEGVFATNKDIFSQFLGQILQQTFQKILTQHLPGQFSSDTPETQQRLIRRTRSLIFIHNLHVIDPYESICQEFLTEIFQSLQLSVGKRSSYSQNMTKILQSLQVDQKQTRRQSRMSIANLYGLPLQLDVFLEQNQNQIRGLVDGFLKQSINYFISQLMPDFISVDMRQYSPGNIRAYIYDWLDLLNQQAATLSLMNSPNSQLLDAVITFTIQKFSLMIDQAQKSPAEQKQDLLELIYLEIKLFESISLKMHGQQSKEAFIRVFETLEQLIPQLSIPTDTLRNSKYKVQYNFKGLFQQY